MGEYQNENPMYYPHKSGNGGRMIEHNWVFIGSKEAEDRGSPKDEFKGGITLTFICSNEGCNRYFQFTCAPPIRYKIIKCCIEKANSYTEKWPCGVDIPPQTKPEVHNL